jgi:hypothetical protein
MRGDISHKAAFLAVLLAFAAIEATGETKAARDVTPAPYEKDEFAPWLKELWRAEIVFVGSFPFTMFFVLEGYDVYKYAANNFNSSYTPWPFRTSSEITYSTTEATWLVVSALASSAIVSLIDFLLVHVGRQPADP